MLSIAMAIGQSGEFSKNGELPWGKPIKEDMEHYVEFTRDKIKVMGYKTWMSLPTKTRERYGENVIIIMNRYGDEYNRLNTQVPVVVIQHKTELSAFLYELSTDDQSEYCLIGGLWLLDTAISEFSTYIDEVMLTIVNGSYSDCESVSIESIIKINKLFMDENIKTKAYDYQSCTVLVGKLIDGE